MQPGSPVSAMRRRKSSCESTSKERFTTYAHIVVKRPHSTLDLSFGPSSRPVDVESMSSCSSTLVCRHAHYLCAMLNSRLQRQGREYTVPRGHKRGSCRSLVQATIAGEKGAISQGVLVHREGSSSTSKCGQKAAKLPHQVCCVR
jgi:hypothetical protein